MRTCRPVVAIASLWLALAATVNAAPAPAAGQLAGRVLVDSAAPLSSVQVYAYQLVDRTLRLATTAGDGEFVFDSLPAGLYKVIAFKHGFAPAVVMLTRASRQAAQWVELQLVAGEESGGNEADFWSVREQVPSDVLREIEFAGDAQAARRGDNRDPQAAQQFLAQMTAETGVTQLLGASDAALTGGEMRLQGHLLGMRLAVDGDYRQLGSERLATSGSSPSGQTTSLALSLLDGREGGLALRSRVDRLTTRVGGHELPVDFAQHGVRWSRAFGPSTESEILAQYTEESGLHAKDLSEPAAIPLASRSFRLEGSYTHGLGEIGQVHAALRYRERSSDYAGSSAVSYLSGESQRQFEAYGGGDLRLAPRVGVSYGILGGLRDGDVAVTPRAGADWKLGEQWVGRVLVSKRFDLGRDGNAWLEEFIPLLLAEDPCDIAGLTCYEIELKRSVGAAPEAPTLAVRGSQREFDRTVRVYFSDDFFDQLDSLFLVPGDRVPEVKIALSRRLGNSVFARLESTAASGGGGSYLAADRQPYRNSVAYLVTSLDTRFAATSTGVVVAFQRLQQELEPLFGPLAATLAQLDLERLELTVTQDLNVFFDLPASWAMRVNMELSRGSTSILEDLPADSVRRRLTTGLSVRF